MENIEERLKEMNLRRVQKKGEELSSQEYDKDITLQYKKMNVIEECPDDTSPIVMWKFVNNEDNDEKEITAENEDEGVIHRDIIEY